MVCDTPFDDAVSVACSVVVTADAVAVNPPVLEPAATVTVAGTCKEPLLLASDTCTELAAGELKYTEHAVEAGPVIVCDPHAILLRVTVVAGEFDDAFSWITSVFDTPLAEAVRVADCVVFTAAAAAVNPAVAEPEGIVTTVGTWSAPLLLESDTFTGLVVAALRYTEHAVVVDPVSVCSPQAILLRVAVVDGGCEPDAFSWITSVFDTPSAEAVSVADCAVFTAAAVAVNPATVEPEGTVTAAGTWSAPLLLESETFTELAAAVVK